MGSPEKCPHCGSKNLETITEGVRLPPGAGAKLACGDCGKWIKWLGKDGPVGEYRLGLPKHRGKTLAEVNPIDRPYLEWIAGEPKFEGQSIQDKVRRFLAENPAPTKSAMPREIPRRGDDKGIEPWSEWQDPSWIPPR